MSSRGGRNLGIGAMPRLGVPVHAEIAQGFKARALEQGVSVRTLVRDLLYEFAREELEIEIADLPPTKMTHK